MQLHRREHLSRHVVVWISRLSQAQASLPFLEPLLDSREQERAARFHFPDDRARFIVGRGLLRKCLGSYLQRDPAGIELTYTDLKRPVLAGSDDIDFSISHTHDLVALAVTSGARVGVDLEFIQPNLDLSELALRIFSPEDLRLFQAVPNDEKHVAFYRAWTRKEAYLKARGEGIAGGLQEVSVSFAPGNVGSIHDSRKSCGAGNWRLQALPVPEGYAGTLACDDAKKRLDGAFVEWNEGEVTKDVSSSFADLDFSSDSDR
jgi:4'-phosphopantetheinyl transferase